MQQQSRPANPHDPARAYRCRLILDLLQSFDRRERERILVIGAATGALAADLHRRFPAADIVGVEGNRDDVELARIAVPSATFIQRDLLREEEVDPRLRGWATTAVCAEVLEHVEEPRQLLRGVAPYLAPGGAIVVAVPGGPMSAFDRRIGHRRHFTSKTLSHLLEEAGFRVRHVQRSGFPFSNLSLLRLDRERSPLGWQIVAAATRD
ncbi:MAG: class I SAM-dependent methyltransferase [Gaiellaceae bacterium]